MSVENPELKAAILNAVRCTFKHLQVHIYTPVHLLPEEDKRDIEKNIGPLADIIQEMIKTERSKMTEGKLSNTVLSKYSTLTDDDGKLLNASDIGPMLFELFFGGVETTASSLQYLVYLLGKNPHVQDKLYDEIKNENEYKITYADLTKLNYLDHVLKEAMRLFPPAPLSARSTLAGTEFMGYQLPANSTVVINVWKIHKDPRFWSNPEQFYPERFLIKNHPAAWGTFGFGVRSCVGQRLTVMESKVALLGLIKNFRIHSLGEKEPEYKMAFTMQPLNKVEVRFEKRI